jgi:peroxiredoxin
MTSRCRRGRRAFGYDAGMTLSTRSRAAVLAATLPLLATLAAAQSAQPPLAPSKGDIVPAFETLGVDGKPAKVDFPKGSKTVLLFFLSGCPHCHRMIPEWNKAFERQPKGLKIVGVIMDPDQAPASFWQEHPIAFPVLRSPGREFLKNLNVNRAPLTLRVGEGGKVEDVGLGEACGAGSTPGSCIDGIQLGALFAPASAAR